MPTTYSTPNDIDEQFELMTKHQSDRCTHWLGRQFWSYWGTNAPKSTVTSLLAQADAIHLYRNTLTGRVEDRRQPQILVD